MFVCYNVKNDSLSPITEEDIKNGQQPIWVDISDPTQEEIDFVATYLGVNISKNNKVIPPKLKNFYLHNKGEVSIKVNVLTDVEGMQTVRVILRTDKVITIRPSVVYSAKEYLDYVITNGNDSNITPIKIFMNGIESRIGHVNSSLERIDDALDEVSQGVFYSEDYIKKQEKDKEIDLKKHIDEIGKNGYIISNNHESLISIGQALNCIKRSKIFKLSSEELEHMDYLINEIASLSEQVSFLSDKLNFLLSICLGMLGIEQNLISKVFSVSALVFLPPAIIASIYGMNFDYIPELKWHYGFPYAIILIIISSIFPYLFCKYKKWI